MDDEKVVAHCVNCGADLYEYDHVLIMGNDFFCDADCVVDYVGAETVTISTEYVELVEHDI